MSTAIREHPTTIAAPAPKDWRRIWLVGVLVIVASAITNFAVDRVLVTVLPSLSEFDDLQVAKIEPFTIVGAIAAVLVFALVYRFSSRPNLLYRVIATVVLALSVLPDLGLLSAVPGASVTAISALFALHITEYLVCVGLLTTKTNEVQRNAHITQN